MRHVEAGPIHLWAEPRGAAPAATPSLAAALSESARAAILAHGRRAIDLCACGHVHVNRIGYVHKVCVADGCRCEGFTPHPQPRLGEAAAALADALGVCRFKTCGTRRAAGSQFCLEHDPHRSAPLPIDDEPTRPTPTPGDAELVADHYAERADMRARLFQLPTGRWHADIRGPGGKFCAISTPSMEKAVYFLARRLGGAE